MKHHRLLDEELTNKKQTEDAGKRNFQQEAHEHGMLVSCLQREELSLDKNHLLHLITEVKLLSVC